MRAAIFGWGRWAPVLARNVAKHAEVVLVVDPSQDARDKASAAGYAVGNGTDDPHIDFDVGVVASPILTHWPHVLRLLNFGKHVLCEKPLAVDREMAERCAHAARRNDAMLMMSAPWLYHPAIQRAGEVAKELGAPIWFRAARTSWDERPLDPIADLLPHDVGILKAWTGQRVAEVSAVAEGPTASITLRTEGGVLGTIQYTYRDGSKRREVEIGCERGSVRSEGGKSVHVSRPSGPVLLPDYADGPEPLDAMCAEFVDCCKTGRTPRFGSIDDALHVAEVIEAAHRSVSERRVVTL